MRIAVVVTGGLHPSGREQVVPSWLSLFGRLARAHNVHAFVLRHLPEASTYELNGMVVHDLGRPSAPLGLTHWAQQRALVRAIDLAGPYDLIHGIWGDPAAFLATRAARHFSIPSVVTLDSGEFVSLPDIGYGSQRTARGRARIREACTKASRVHVCTEFMAREVEKFGITPAIIPLGVDEPEGSSPQVGGGVDEPEGSSPQVGGGVNEPEGSSPQVGGGKPLGLPDGPPWRLLQVASLSRVKNQALLIDALAIMARSADVHLDLVGEDTLGGTLRARAVALGMGDRVTFHGFVHHDQIAAIRSRAHVYVQTSRHESAGVAVLEAAMNGTPVIGTAVGYVADWAPGGAAAIKGDASPGELADATVALLRDSIRRRQLAASALAFARAHDADRTAEDVEKMYAALHILQHR